MSGRVTGTPSTYAPAPNHETPRLARSQVNADLAGKLAKHVRDMGYLLQGDLAVEMVLDPDLEIGYFGILAQRVYPQQSAAGKAAQPGPVAAAPAAGAGGVGPASGASAAPAAGQMAAAGAAGAAAAASPQPGPAELTIPASTEVLAAKQAQELESRPARDRHHLGR